MPRLRLLLPALAVSLVLAAPATAGHNTYYRIKGGSMALQVKAAKQLKSDHGIVIKKKIGPLALKRGGLVYHSNRTMNADLARASKIVLRYDTRGADGRKGGVTTLKLNRLSLHVGARNSFLIGRVSGSSTVPGVRVRSGELRILNIAAGKVKKSRAKGQRYSFSSSRVTFNSALTNMLNSFGTPIGNKHASAKLRLGRLSVKLR